MLKHGIQEMNKVELFLPMKDNKKPNREYLDLRFKKFKQKAAG
jgi:hypothetical protein